MHIVYEIFKNNSTKSIFIMNWFFLWIFMFIFYLSEGLFVTSNLPVSEFSLADDEKSTSYTISSKKCLFFRSIYKTNLFLFRTNNETNIFIYTIYFGWVFPFSGKSSHFLKILKQLKMFVFERHIAASTTKKISLMKCY